MKIIYESKTGFTKKYALMFAEKTGLEAIDAKNCSKLPKDEEIIFFGWMKVGKIQGLNKVRGYNIAAVCATGTGRTAEPDAQTVISRSKIENKQFFYLRGGCLPLKALKGLDKFMLTLFVKMLKKRKNPDERTQEAIFNIENGFDGVKRENLNHLSEWLNIYRQDK